MPTIDPFSISRALHDLSTAFPWYEFFCREFSTEKLQDKRTIEEMQTDYDIGIEMENRIIKYIKTLWVVYTNDNKDKRLNPSCYAPDCIILYKQEFTALEIKYTKHNIDKVQRKLNQYTNMLWHHWWLLQVSGNRFCLIHSWTAIGKYKTKEETYCNKDCMEFEVVWRPINDLKLLFTEKRLDKW